MKNSHVEKSYFSRTVIEVNTTFVGRTNMHISPNAREINVSYILALMHGSIIIIPSGFIIYVETLIHRVSPYKQDFDYDNVHIPGHFWQRFSEWLIKSWRRRKPFSKDNLFSPWYQKYIWILIFLALKNNWGWRTYHFRRYRHNCH